MPFTRPVVRFATLVALCMPLTPPVLGDVTITQLANEGVMVSDADTRIMIDGMVVDSYSVYGGLDAAAAADFAAAAGAFSGVDLALVSHRHHDHNQPAHACVFMQGSAQTRLETSPQVIGLMRERCRPFVTSSPRIAEILPAYGEPVVLQQGGARVTVFPLSHGVRKYAKIQNFGHLLEMGGITLLHIGDAAMDPTDFERAALRQQRLDVAFIPFWYFQPGPGAELVGQYLDARIKIAVHIPPGEMDEVKTHLEQNYPEVVVLDRPLRQLEVSSTEPR